MVSLFGTVVAYAALALWALFAWDARFAPYLLVGSAPYLVGTILLTIVYHVPRNEALPNMKPRGADAKCYWPGCRSGWTTWSHIRVASALAASTTLAVALTVALRV